MEEAKLEANGLKLKNFSICNNVEKFDLSFTMTEGKDEIFFSVSYATSLFNNSTITRITEHFKNILNETITNTDVKLKDIQMLSEVER